MSHYDRFSSYTFGSIRDMERQVRAEKEDFKREELKRELRKELREAKENDDNS